MTDDQHPDPAAAAGDEQRPEPPDLPPETLQLYLNIWNNAWVSGYVSSAVSAANRVGIPRDKVQTMAHAVEHHAGHTIESIMHDPISRHTVVDAIQRIAAGQFGAGGHHGLLPVTCHPEKPRSEEP